jgi:hypothetical protein
MRTMLLIPADSALSAAMVGYALQSDEAAATLDRRPPRRPFSLLPRSLAQIGHEIKIRISAQALMNISIQIPIPTPI